MPFPFAETLSHLSVKFKLALGFGLVLLLTCIIAATGWQALAASVDRSEKLTSIARLVHLTKDLRAERITYRVLADTTSQANMQTALTNIQLQLDSLSQRMKDPFHLDLARQQRNTLDQFRATLATLAQHHDEGAPMMLTLKQKAGYALVALVRAQTNLLTSAGRNHDDEHWRGPFKQLEQLRRQIDDASVAVQTPAYRFEGLEAYSAFAAAAISRLDNALGEVEVWLSQPPYQADSDLERVKLVLSSYSQHLEDLKAAQLITESAHARMEELGEHLLHTNDALSSSQQEKRDHEALDNRITLLSTTGMALLLGLIAAGLITRQILLPLHQSLRAAQRIASGDLSRDIETSRRDELGQLQRSMQQMVLCLRELMGAIGQSSAQVNDAASQLSTATRQSHLNIRQQREETDQVATAMHEMTATALEVARNAECASEAATEADQHAREGDRVVIEAITQIEQLADEVTRSSQAMGRLKQESEKIGGVLDVIKSVSQQTNLLALNAAIEAARAGEAGRGFSVVADEVRSLAKRTQSSAEEIEALIGGLQQGTQDVARQLDCSLTLTLSSVELSRRTGLALERISGSVSRIQGMNLQIASAGEEQSVVAEQINVSILTVRDMAERAADASEETATASVELARLGEHLKDSVSHFRL